MPLHRGAGDVFQEVSSAITAVNGGSPSMSLPAGAVAGDILILATVQTGDFAAYTVAIDSALTIISELSWNVGADEGLLKLFAVTLSAADITAGTISWTYTGAGSAYGIAAVLYRTTETLGTTASVGSQQSSSALSFTANYGGSTAPSINILIGGASNNASTLSMAHTGITFDTELEDDAVGVTIAMAVELITTGNGASGTASSNDVDVQAGIAGYAEMS